MVCRSRPYHFKFFKDCLAQVLLDPFLNNLTHLSLELRQLFMNLHIVNSRPLSIIISLVEDGADIDKLHKKNEFGTARSGIFEAPKTSMVKKIMLIFVRGSEKAKSCRSKTCTHISTILKDKN